jgi:hypothetical protein
MKSLILIFVSVLLLILTLTSNVFCQATENKTWVPLDPSLQSNLNNIDKYVKKIDSSKLILVSSHVGEMTNGGTTEDYQYNIDSSNTSVVKIIEKTINVKHPESSTNYYQNRQLVYSKVINDPAALKPTVNEIYYKNGKILYNRIQGNDPEKIIKIIYDYGGGKLGYGLGFSASKDSMVLVLDTIYSQQLHRYLNNGLRKKATNQDEWNKLVDAIDLKSFDQIKSGRNMREIDGSDLHITIVTNVRSHYLIVDQTNQKQVKAFMDELSSQIASFKQAAIRQKGQ